MFTTIAFSESQDPGGVYVKMAGVPDQHIKVEGDGIYIMEFNRLFGVMSCAGTTGLESRLVSPSLRRVNPYYIAPIELALFPDGEPHYQVNPNVSIPLDTNEALEAEILSDPAVAEQNAMVVWLSSGGITPVSGNIYTVNAEVTVALTAGTWAFSEIDFVDELPVGNYEVVGARAVIDTAVALRFVPVGASHRPGLPVTKNVEFGRLSVFRQGQLGSWFTFNTVQPPGVEILGSVLVGSATYQIYLDILKR